MIEQQILELTRRIGKVEAELEGIHRLEIALAEIKASVGILKWTLPLVVSIGGVTVAALALIR